MQNSNRGLTTGEVICLVGVLLISILIDGIMMVPWHALDFNSVPAVQAAVPLLVAAIVTGSIGVGMPLVTYLIDSGAGLGTLGAPSGHPWAGFRFSRLFQWVIPALVIFVVMINAYANIRDRATKIAQPATSMQLEARQRTTALEAAIAKKRLTAAQIVLERAEIARLEHEWPTKMTDRGRGWYEDFLHLNIQLTPTQAEAAHETLQSLLGVLATVLVPNWIASAVLAGARRRRENSRNRHWFDEVFVLGDRLELNKADAFSAYTTYCAATSKEPLQQAEFLKVLEGRCVEAGVRGKKSPSRRWVGIGVRQKTKGRP